MLATGHQIKHFDKVDLRTIHAVEPYAHHRQSLSYKYLDREGERSAVVILMNPSSANADFADRTVRRVQGVLYHLFSDITDVTILNLFTIRGKTPADLNSVYRKMGKKGVVCEGSDDFVREKIEKNKSGIVIAGWGGPCGIDKDLHAERVKFYSNLLKGNSNLYRIVSDKYKPSAPYPLHAKIWGYNMRPYKVSL